MIWKNLIKYTIGLPLLICLTIGMFFMAIFIFILEFGGECLGVLIEGDCSFSNFCSLDVFGSIIQIWSPIK